MFLSDFDLKEILEERLINLYREELFNMSLSEIVQECEDLDIDINITIKDFKRLDR